MCANNGLSLTHTASHCRISNQICEGCLAKGHHIIDCPQIGCDGYGSKVGHESIGECPAGNYFDNYCEYIGHFPIFCPIKRYDEYGY